MAKGSSGSSSTPAWGGGGGARGGAAPPPHAGVQLCPDEPFAIDPHPFRDTDGQWYLYYAVDRLEGERVGTTVVVDRLATMTRLAGQAQVAVPATGDWQLFLAQRTMYGQVYDWHTVEGPFVREREGRYYCLYSGGNWEQLTYGVSYAVADHPLGPFKEPDVEQPALLRTVPGRVIGPGHNSVVEGPDGEDYLVYHAWDPELTARRMCIDRLTWGPEGPSTAGPTWTPQPVPGS